MRLDILGNLISLARINQPRPTIKTQETTQIIQVA
jgi:hypothetical protein